MPSPIRRVLSSMREHGVRHLLMGGQSRVFYGGAESKRNTDLAALANRGNLTRLGNVLDARAKDRRLSRVRCER